jgi:ArsR family transcriptional regulator
MYEEKARIFKALCDENRLRILELLHNGERCACKLLDDLNIQQSTLSHHMKILCDAGIVKGRKDGKWMHYSIDLEGSQYAQEVLKQLLAVNIDEQDCCCR